jgi:hypothetical protein
MALFNLFLYLFLSCTLFVVHSPPGDQLWNVESIFALSHSGQKNVPSPLFYHVIFFQKHGRRSWKIQRLIALFSGEELGGEINFPFYSTQILTLVTWVSPSTASNYTAMI